VFLEELDKIEEEAGCELREADSQDKLSSWHTRYLGRKGRLTSILKSIGALSLEKRKEVGARANQVKERLTFSFWQRKDELSYGPSLREDVDITLPGRPFTYGSLHPTTKVLREICTIFSGLGFGVVEGPEIEEDYYNFEALNMPQDHPARDMWATLWMENGLLLRTHTSPMQIRIMEKASPPIRVIVPGRCYRYEATDATHESMFYQVEGLAVDKGITLAHLKGTLTEFSSLLFGEERKIRFRCDYFPFVEPGMEMSIECLSCQGKGCRMCRGSGWLEILGAGMVHPRVLERVNIDPEVYSGFAFGMGVERIPMLKYGIDDIRHFYADDLRFLAQSR
jgi:phenylalanyl-tRNA synthetase alpha chain